MAISKTGIHVDESSSFNNPLVYEENGQVNSVVADNLTPDTRYYTRAYVISDGTTVYSGNVRSFTTPDYIFFHNPNNYDIQLTLTKVNNPKNIVLESCILGDYNWYANFDFTGGSTSISETIPAGKTLVLRGRNESFYYQTIDNYGWYNFSCADTIEVSGNIMTLLNYENPSTSMASTASFANLFKDMTGLENVGIKLPATTLGNSKCYASLFEGCSSMTIAPKLPATRLKQWCYQKMFKGTAITEAPDLPATAIDAQGPYDCMFEDARYLVKAPKLVATSDSVNLYAYSAMFRRCVSLESVEIYGDIYSTRMLEGCSSLNEIIYHASTFTNAYHDGWVLNAGSGSGSFYNLNGATIPTNSDDGIPSGWTEYNSI